MKTFAPLLALLAACGGFNVAAVTPTAGPDSLLNSAPVSAVQVNVAQMAPDKVNMLARFQIAETVQDRLTASFQSSGRLGPGGMVVQVTISDFRNPRYGPAFMGAQVQVVDAAGQVLRAFEAREQTSRMTSRTSRLGIITQGIVTRTANGI